MNESRKGVHRNMRGGFRANRCIGLNVVNQSWNEVAGLADVDGKTPHSARQAMGRHIIEKTGIIAAVQRQLGHKNAAYSMQYARISEKELAEVIEDRRKTVFVNYIFYVF